MSFYADEELFDWMISLLFTEFSALITCQFAITTGFRNLGSYILVHFCFTACILQEPLEQGRHYDGCDDNDQNDRRVQL